jgi:hypothetical protein
MQQDKNKGKGKGQGSVERSLVDRHEAKDFVPCKNKQNPSGEEFDKQIAKYAQKTDKKRFVRVVKGTGLGTKKLANRWFYSALAQQYKIDPPKTCGAGAPAHTYDVWNEGDNPDSLDMYRTIMNGGRTLPGITTRKRTGKPTKEYKKVAFPDLLLVIDSSISMPDPTGYLSIPVLSCMAAAHSAMDRGKEVAVVNFANDSFVCPYTINRDKVEEAIITYLNQGTTIPGRKIWEVAKSNPNPQHIIIVSDTQICDLEKELGYLRKSIKKAGGGTIFLFGNASDDTNMLKSIGYDVKQVSTQGDLLQLTKNLSWKLYGGKNA